MQFVFPGIFLHWVYFIYFYSNLLHKRPFGLESQFFVLKIVHLIIYNNL